MEEVGKDDLGIQVFLAVTASLPTELAVSGIGVELEGVLTVLEDLEDNEAGFFFCTTIQGPCMGE